MKAVKMVAGLRGQTCKYKLQELGQQSDYTRGALPCGEGRNLLRAILFNLNREAQLQVELSSLVIRDVLGFFNVYAFCL